MPSQEFDFKKLNSLEKRKLNSDKIINKYPDRIPIIVEKDKGSRGLNNIDKNKFMVPYELTLGQILYIIKQRIKIEPTQSLYLFCGNSLPPTSQLIGNIYKEHKDEDGFLYIIYCAENTFGF